MNGLLCYPFIQGQFLVFCNRLNSDLGYFEHERLDHQFKDLKVKHQNLKIEAKETVLKSNKYESDLEGAKQEIVTLQKVIQNIQVCDEICIGFFKTVYILMIRDWY